MRVLTFSFSILALFASPALCSAGPIQFQITPTGIFIEPGLPAIDATLTPAVLPAALQSFEATAGPTVVPVVSYTPSNLPTPDPIHIHDGSTHWTQVGIFRVDYRLTDAASGESADLSMWGRAHLYNYYSVGNGWTGDGYFWFLEQTHATLGGNDYTLWGNNHYSGDAPSVSVWVGDNPPVHASPEPASLALAAFGLVPLGLRRLRR